MFAALARWLQLRSAARRYARALGPQLRQDFGAGPFYTRQQIGKSAARAGLPMRHLAFGYAGFMDEASFVALRHLETNLSYAQLRAMLARHTGRAVSTGFEPAPETSGVTSVVDISHGSHS